MRELSLNILDIAQNSISAGAGLIEIEIENETGKGEMTVRITDNGKGMDSDTVRMVQDPFYTTRKTRAVGMGVPLFKMAAEQTGGYLRIESEPAKGTRVTAVFKTQSIDFTPLGDMPSTMCALVSANEKIDFVYRYTQDGEVKAEVDTREMREMLGDVPLNDPQVILWLRENITL